MEKRYDFSADAERALYDTWEQRGAFRCAQGEAQGEGQGEKKNTSDPYTIMMPPPNVTGRLHIGHALDNTLQDILARLRRQQGYDCLWLPGTDHAGIATQLLVGRHLAQQGVAVETLSREEFLKHTWQWKEQYGNIILQQLRRLGASCDWQKARFTMDEGLSCAVRRAFLTLYEDGLIYRDQRLVNWDPHLQTAISDLEVRQQEEQGQLCLIDYPLVVQGKEKGAAQREREVGESITIATTRPETLFGDLAVAVHPEDERYSALVGLRCRVPLAEREVPIIADERVLREQGTGALKITPAHDFLDFEIGKQHGLALLSIFDAQARLNEHAPTPYRGLSREAARERVVADLKEQGLLREVRGEKHSVPYGERSGVALEPRLTKQWFMKMEDLATRALEAVEKDETKLIPQTWVNTWRQWLENIQPWCLSRQLWWGHRIPIWYTPEGEQIAASSEQEALTKAQEKFGYKVALTQDEDVLDTWFSSSLWSFSTLGWGNKEGEQVEEATLYKRYFPTSLLVTGFDILFFWVARMMMMSLYFTKRVPFRVVYLHALIRDAKGRKMSKSVGNVIDPIELMDRFGADALRFTLASQAMPGRDLRLSEKRIEGNRNFMTKIWNAARFLEMQGGRYEKTLEIKKVKGSAHRWMLVKLRDVAKGVKDDLDDEKCLFHEASLKLYHFVWGVFCDQYLEMIKPVLMGEGGEENEQEKEEARKVSAWVYYGILRMLHPFVPFVTERIFQESEVFAACRAENKDALLMKARGLREEDITIGDDWEGDGGDVKDVSWVLGLIDEIRSTRSALGLQPSVVLSWFGQIGFGAGENFHAWKSVVRAMAGVEWLAESPKEERVLGFVYDRIIEPKLALPEDTDLGALKLIIEKKIKNCRERESMLSKKIDNENFKANALELWKEECEKLSGMQNEMDWLHQILEDIKKLNS